jgi:hypothetical protein
VASNKKSISFDELERIGKEEVEAYSKAVPSVHPEELRKTMKNLLV